MNHRSGIVTSILVAFATSSACAAPTPAPAVPAMVPPTTHYDYMAVNSDATGKYKLYKNFITGTDQFGKSPKYWIKVARFTSGSDDKTEYPAQYLRFELDCQTLTYAITAKFDLAADGHDLNPTGHFSKNPIRHKIPGTKNNVYVKPGVSPPSMVAAGVLEQDCSLPG